MNAYEIEQVERQVKADFRLPLGYEAWADIEHEGYGLCPADAQHGGGVHRRPAATRSLRLRQAPPRFPPPSSSAAGLRLSCLGQPGQ
jgi:hypothetical protein